MASKAIMFLATIDMYPNPKNVSTTKTPKRIISTYTTESLFSDITRIRTIVSIASIGRRNVSTGICKSLRIVR